MAPVYSTLRCNQQQREILSQYQSSNNLTPAIEFYPKYPKREKEKDSKTSKSESVREFEVLNYIHKWILISIIVKK